MAEPLRILLLEDNPIDAELIQFELQESGLAFIAKVVLTEKDFIHELQGCFPDLILSDYDLPKYNGALALAEANRRCPDIPFILVSGAIVEDRAIEILTQGAKDYVLKAKLEKRLGPAVKRALAEAEELRARKQAEAELREINITLEERVKTRTAELEAEIEARKKTEEKYAKTFISNPVCIGLSRLSDSLIIEANDALLNLLDYSKDEFIGHTATKLGFWHDWTERERLLETLKAEGSVKNQEYMLRTRTGQFLLCNYSAEMIVLDKEPHMILHRSDISL